MWSTLLSLFYTRAFTSISLRQCTKSPKLLRVFNLHWRRLMAQNYDMEVASKEKITWITMLFFLKQIDHTNCTPQTKQPSSRVLNIKRPLIRIIICAPKNLSKSHLIKSSQWIITFGFFLPSHSSAEMWATLFATLRAIFYLKKIKRTHTYLHHNHANVEDALGDSITHATDCDSPLSRIGEHFWSDLDWGTSYLPYLTDFGTTWKHGFV